MGAPMANQYNAPELAAVLEQLADHSSDSDLRGHVRQVVSALRSNGLIILNGPPQEAMRRPWPYDGPEGRAPAHREPRCR